MDDGEVVAAIAAGDPGGLAAAYDTYAASLYGYCRWMLRDPGLATELARRGDAVPVLRLPVPEPRPAPVIADGYETLVRLPFRDDAAAAAAAQAMDALDPTLLLVLPALGEIRIERPGLAQGVA